MKKILYITYIVSALILVSCAEDFLEKKNLFEQSDESFYRNSNDIAVALAAAYEALPLDPGNNNPFIVSDLMSDDCFGGGGINDDGFHGTDAFTLPPDADYYMPLYETTYRGLLRVNMILKRFDQAEYKDENMRKQDLGETYFLRGYFYFRLAQYFGRVPLKTDPAPANLPKATPEELFAQIASDLKQAIELMPSTKYNAGSAEQAARLGHATKWAAEALMARVFLFYTGYYEQASLPLVDGGTISKDQVIAWLDDCITKSGHGLIPDFRNLWSYTYADGYPYVDNNGLEWIGDGPENIETIFSINYSVFGGWDPSNNLECRHSNQHSLYVGLRQQFYLPFGQGWGGGPVNPQLWNSFEAGDLRKQGSILSVNASDGLTDEGDAYTNFQWGGDNQMHETGYWQKKYMPTYINDPASNTLAGMFYVLYGGMNNMQQWNMQDDILIRFADVLLMAAELKGAGAGDAHLNAVRNRAGLANSTATLDNIKLERRHELAFEGLRYFDLLRWHDAEAAFAVATNIPVKNVNLDVIYTVNYRPETGGFLPLPQSEVLLSNGVLEQTPGWE